MAGRSGPRRMGYPFPQGFAGSNPARSTNVSWDREIILIPYKAPYVMLQVVENKLVEAVFTDEDKKNLKVIAEELPKLRIIVEELKETLEVLSDEKLMKSITASQKDVQEKRVFSYKELLHELNIDEKEL